MINELRIATRDAHSHLDARLSPDGAWTLLHYQRLLQMSLAIVGPLEPDVDAFLPGFSSAALTRSQSLRDDLRAMGATPLMTARPELPPIDSQAAAFGAAYVLQGSMLGGAVIKRAVERDLGPDAPPMRYLSYHGDRLSQVWRDFLFSLETFGQRSDDHERSRTVETATATFGAFAAVLSELNRASRSL